MNSSGQCVIYVCISMGAGQVAYIWFIIACLQVEVSVETEPYSALDGRETEIQK